MKITVFVECFSRQTETFIYDQTVRLSENGHDVCVITLTRINATDRPFGKVIVIPNPAKYSPVTLINYNYGLLFNYLRNRVLGKNTVIRGHELNKKYYRKELKKILNNTKPDLFLVHFGHMGCLCGPVACKLNLNTVVTYHGFDASKLIKTGKWLSRYQQLWKYNFVFTTPSGYLRNLLIQAGAPADKVKVLPPGISLNNWKYSNPAKRFDGKKIYYLFVGRLVEKKSPLQLIDAFNICKNNLNNQFNPELVICGSGPLMNEVINKINNLDLNNDVHILGACSHQTVKDWMAKAHIYVQHSIHAINGDSEGLPNSIVEAAASGLPIISTRHSGILDIVKENENGYLVDENDYVTMGNLMAKIAHESDKWGEFGRAGRKTIEHFYSDKDQLTNIIALTKHT